MRLASCAARELRVYSFCFVCSGGGAGLKSAPGAQGLDSSKGPPEFHFLEPVLIPDSATRHWQPQILLRARRRPVSLTSSCHTWSPPMCAHHRCSRRERVVTCGTLRTGNTWTSRLVSRSMLWGIVMLVLWRSLLSRYERPLFPCVYGH